MPSNLGVRASEKWYVNIVDLNTVSLKCKATTLAPTDLIFSPTTILPEYFWFHFKLWSYDFANGLLGFVVKHNHGILPTMEQNSYNQEVNKRASIGQKIIIVAQFYSLMVARNQTWKTQKTSTTSSGGGFGSKSAIISARLLSPSSSPCQKMQCSSCRQISKKRFRLFLILWLRLFMQNELQI